ncbi:MAG: hypothetical protein LBJ61_04335 [Deltaproteobacteria bacterium]|nr:hypothetical protein [Deltaproteobacteria bacterium]
MSKGPKKTPARGLDERLDCFGNYEASDQICHRRCALSISCAVARGEYLDDQVLDADMRPRPASRPVCRK